MDVGPFVRLDDDDDDDDEGVVGLVAMLLLPRLFDLFKLVDWTCDVAVVGFDGKLRVVRKLVCLNELAFFNWLALLVACCVFGYEMLVTFGDAAAEEEEEDELGDAEEEVIEPGLFRL